jgi:hypothetical protein
MRQIEVEYNGKKIVLSEATTAMSIKRELLRSTPVVDGSVEERIAGNMFYPDIMACVVCQDVWLEWPPTVEQFVNEWPARLTDALRETVYDLNPHWWPKHEEEEVKKKELPQPTG